MTNTSTPPPARNPATHNVLKIGIFVINLDRSPERLAFMAKQLAALHLPWERITAVDGAAFPPEELPPGWSPELNRLQYHRTLSKGEIATFHSHRLAWRRIVEEGWGAALILEDDVELFDNLPTALDILASIAEEWEAVKLYARKRHPLVKPKPLDGGKWLLGNYIKTPVIAAGYVLNAAAAGKLLVNTENFGSPVDVIMQHHWLTNVRFKGLKPYVVGFPEKEFSSDIDSCGYRREKHSTHPFSRQWQQVLYNAKVYSSAIKQNGVSAVLTALFGRSERTCLPDKNATQIMDNQRNDVHDGKPLYAYWMKNTNCKNFGDALTPFLLEKLTGRKVVHCDVKVRPLLFLPTFLLYGFMAPFSAKKRLRIKSLFHSFFASEIILAIGSIVEHARNGKAVVWGSGLMNSKSVPRRASVASVASVRGPLTRQRFIDAGIDVPEIYGDPALLASWLWPKESASAENDLLLIPHLSHYPEAVAGFSEKTNILNLDGNPLEKLREIQKCRRVLSSSLHGIIVAHAYGIPALWVKLGTRKSRGDDVKFADYFLSVGIEPYKAFRLDAAASSTSQESFKESVDILFSENKHRSMPTVDLRQMCGRLCHAAPFEIAQCVRMED